MTTIDLYERLKEKFQAAPLVLDANEVQRLSAPVNSTVALRTLRAYFPNGVLTLTASSAVAKPAAGKPMELNGTGSGPLFGGMAVEVELWTEEKSPGNFELHFKIQTFGASRDAPNVWILK